ncbi:hypothetical protein Nmel_017896 [Mimus melanotis]
MGVGETRRVLLETRILLRTEGALEGLWEPLEGSAIDWDIRGWTGIDLEATEWDWEALLGTKKGCGRRMGGEGAGLGGLRSPQAPPPPAPPPPALSVPIGQLEKPITDPVQSR